MTYIARTASLAAPDRPMRTGCRAAGRGDWRRGLRSFLEPLAQITAGLDSFERMDIQRVLDDTLAPLIFPPKARLRCCSGVQNAGQARSQACLDGPGLAS